MSVDPSSEISGKAEAAASKSMSSALFPLENRSSPSKLMVVW